MKNNLLLIINSDDFGINNSVNKAIVSCFESGIISSATLMANMPGFEDAVNYTHTNPILKNKIGLHMNLTEGKPLTDLIKKCDRFCNKDGYLIYDRKKPVFFLNAQEQKAIYTEIKAQIAKLTEHNIYPTHLDSHHHVHTEFGIVRPYLEAAKESGITKMRLSKNIGNISYAKKVYKNIFNFYLHGIKKIATTGFFCSANEFRQLMDKNGVIPGSSYEVMVHAKINAEGKLIDIDNSDIKNKIDPILASFNPVSYFEVKRN